MSRTLLKASFTLVGAIIGAGIFALPAAFHRVGALPASIVFWSMAILVVLTHLMFVDVELALEKRGRLASAVRKWLGAGAYRLASVTYPFQLSGALIAYLLLGAGFLQALLQPLTGTVSVLIWQICFWVGGAITVVAGLKWVARVESVVIWFLISILLLLSIWHWPMRTYAVSGDWSSAFGLFGICLFSLTGISGIGEVVDLTSKKRRQARLAIVIGTLLAALISWTFALSFAGSLTNMNENGVRILALVGFLAVSGAFMITSQDLGATLWLDLGVPRLWSIGLAIGAPLLFVLFTQANTYRVIDTVGALFGGLNGVLIALVASRLYAYRHDTKRNWREFACLLVGLVYLLGIAHWLWNVSV